MAQVSVAVMVWGYKEDTYHFHERCQFRNGHGGVEFEVAVRARDEGE